jgi:hypothetical protein
MGTMTATVAVQQIDPQIEQAYHRTQLDLTKAQNQLQSEERTLAELTSQFNEQCRLQAMGKKADPQQYRDKVSQIEQRIIGHKGLLAECQARFNAAVQERNNAFNEQQSVLDRQRAFDLYDKFLAAQAALTEGWAAVRRAQADERAAGNAWHLECARNPSAAQLIAHRGGQSRYIGPAGRFLVNGS